MSDWESLLSPGPVPLSQTVPKRPRDGAEPRRRTKMARRMKPPFKPPQEQQLPPGPPSVAHHTPPSEWAMAQLPPDVLLHMYTLMEMEDVLHMALACKSMRAAVLGSCQRFYYSGQDFESAVRLLQKMPQLREIVFRSAVLDQKGVVRAVGEKLPWVQLLTLDVGGGSSVTLRPDIYVVPAGQRWSCALMGASLQRFPHLTVSPCTLHCEQTSMPRTVLSKLTAAAERGGMRNIRLMLGGFNREPMAELLAAAAPHVTTVRVSSGSVALDVCKLPPFPRCRSLLLLDEMDEEVCKQVVQAMVPEGQALQVLCASLDNWEGAVEALKRAGRVHTVYINFDHPGTVDDAVFASAVRAASPCRVFLDSMQKNARGWKWLGLVGVHSLRLLSISNTVITRRGDATGQNSAIDALAAVCPETLHFVLDKEPGVRTVEDLSNSIHRIIHKTAPSLKAVRVYSRLMVSGDGESEPVAELPAMQRAVGAAASLGVAFSVEELQRHDQPTWGSLQEAARPREFRDTE